MASPENIEKLGQVARLLAEADLSVWSQMGYPQDHRPDIGYLAQHIFLGRGVRTMLRPHPNLKPKYFAATKDALKQTGLAHDIRVAEYDPFRREMVIDPALFNHDERWQRRVIVHESAHDLSDRMVSIPGTALPSENQRGTERDLEQLFKRNTAPKLRQITIKQSGFRKFVFAGENLIGEQPRPIPSVTEVYPTIVELVTDQIMDLNGDISKFDQLAAQDKLPFSQEKNNPNFFNYLAQAMTYVDWRILLDAFKTGDIEQTLNRLEAAHKEAANGIFLNLTEAIEDDEKMHMQSQIKSRLARFH